MRDKHGKDGSRGWWVIAPHPQDLLICLRLRINPNPGSESNRNGHDPIPDPHLIPDPHPDSNPNPDSSPTITLAEKSIGMVMVMVMVDRIIYNAIEF